MEQRLKLTIIHDNKQYFHIFCVDLRILYKYNVLDS